MPGYLVGCPPEGGKLLRLEEGAEVLVEHSGKENVLKGEREKGGKKKDWGDGSQGYGKESCKPNP